ncbi:MAG TPA: hypothetical protein PLS69_10410, partial [Terricaulis sp.]|nr:hypothetical protein [Terricaulis sp.]
NRWPFLVLGVALAALIIATSWVGALLISLLGLPQQLGSLLLAPFALVLTSIAYSTQYPIYRSVLEAPPPAGADVSESAGNGYVPEAYVIAAAQQAGLELAARSEINANPADTRDHPFGVWTLPPTRQSAPRGQAANPAFDHAPYDAIGESDRMTLRFRKPA